MGEHASPKELNPSGVPQGSVLGPLFFLIYINDIHQSSDKLNFFLFADDTTLLFAHKNLKVLEQVINSELTKVSEWLIANKLSLNIKKSNYVIFCPKQKKVNREISIKMYDTSANRYCSVERKDFVKFLGILIDCNLKWKHHIDFVSLKISKTIGILARLRHFVPTETLLMIYRSLILPYLSYGICVWGLAAKSYINKLLVLQKRALRLIYFAPSNAHAIPFFMETKILPVNMIYFDTVANLMHDIWKGQAPLPIRAFSTFSLSPMKFTGTTQGMLQKVIIIRKKLSWKFLNGLFRELEQ